MKRFILISIIAFVSLSVFAQRNRPSFEQFQQMKLDFIVKEMGLNDSEIQKFSPVYKELIKERSTLYSKYRANGKIKRAIHNGENVADSTMQRISRDDAQLQIEDAKLEQEYQQKFEKILTPQQVCKWRDAEQKFRSDLMRRRPHKQ